MRQLTLPRTLMILLSLQALCLVTYVGLLFWYRSNGPNCDVLLEADAAYLSLMVFWGLCFANIALTVIYALRIFRGEVKVRSRLNIVIAVLILINMSYLLPQEWLGRALRCHFG